MQDLARPKLISAVNAFEGRKFNYTPRNAFEAWGPERMWESTTQFRGPYGDGVSDAKKLPIEWGEDENVAWTRTAGRSSTT